MQSHEFKPYETVVDGHSCYSAGLPGYPENFTRDTLISGIIAASDTLLDSQLPVSSELQGVKYDPMSGEEPGKIHHQSTGVVVNAPYNSKYNACDTSALYVTGVEIRQQQNVGASDEPLARYRANVERAVGYIARHVDQDGIFWEYPPPGADHYSLKVTYWKDSIVPSASGKEEPTYPVAYALAHFQNARGVLAAADILDRPDLRELADEMFRQGIGRFVTEKAFCVSEDGDGRLEQISSDELHALAYIPPAYASLLPLHAIRDRASSLVTGAGIACTPEAVSQALADRYHGYVVWPFEQAMINYGANKFGLDDIKEVTRRCVPYIGKGQELFGPDGKPLGNDLQLWSVAAKIYFSDAPSLRGTSLL